MKTASTAQKQYAKQLSDHIEIVHLYKKIFQKTSFRLNQFVSVYVIYTSKKKKEKNPAFIIGDDKKKASGLTTTENNALLCLYVIWVWLFTKRLKSLQFRDLKNIFLSVSISYIKYSSPYWMQVVQH